MHDSSTHDSSIHDLSMHGSSTHDSSIHDLSMQGSSTHDSSAHGSSTHENNRPAPGTENLLRHLMRNIIFYTSIDEEYFFTQIYLHKTAQNRPPETGDGSVSLFYEGRRQGTVLCLFLLKRPEGDREYQRIKLVNVLG